MIWRRQSDGDQRRRRWQIWRSYRDGHPVMRGECYRVAFPDLGYRLAYHHNGKEGNQEQHFICEGLLSTVYTPVFGSFRCSSFPTPEEITYIARSCDISLPWVQEEPLPWLLEQVARQRDTEQRLVVISRLWVLRKEIWASPAFTGELLRLLFTERQGVARQALGWILPEPERHLALALTQTGDR